ncbi:MAG: hypothetical protein H6585_13330 [Flavobacteriales bacterium]|nr:hypothetical protein [Flavobacteriales bacterium]MCB9449316.1 hypothetical protein [Flavobacteriales bacterium]
MKYMMFIRVGKNSHIDALQRKGEIYCNTTKFFRNLEEKETVQGDTNENRSIIKQVSNVEILIDGKPIAKAHSAQLYADHPNSDGNIYCLYGVNSNQADTAMTGRQKISIDPRVMNFGTSALLIYNPQEFKFRIESTLNSLSKEFHFSSVKYYDPKSYEGGLGPFCKSEDYKYQQEVRLWIPSDMDQPFKFSIGDISDISYKFPIADLDKIGVEHISI